MDFNFCFGGFGPRDPSLLAQLGLPVVLDLLDAQNHGFKSISGQFWTTFGFGDFGDPETPDSFRRFGSHVAALGELLPGKCSYLVPLYIRFSSKK